MLIYLDVFVFLRSFSLCCIKIFSSLKFIQRKHIIVWLSFINRTLGKVVDMNTEEKWDSEISSVASMLAKINIFIWENPQQEKYICVCIYQVGEKY